VGRSSSSGLRGRAFRMSGTRRVATRKASMIARNASAKASVEASALSSIGLHLPRSNRSFPFSPTQGRDKREIRMRFAQRREGRTPLHFERVDYSVVVKNRAPLRNRGDGFIELGLYQLYQLKECFLACALRGYDIWKSMNYNNIRMPLDPDMRTRNFIQIIKRDVNYPRYGNKKRRSLHPGGKIVCHHLGSLFIIRCRERTPKL
jgi:hypothetical protein